MPTVVKGVASSRGKLIKSLESSIELFEELKEVVSSRYEFTEKFSDSISSIEKSIAIIKHLNREDYGNLIADMKKNIYSSS